MRTAGIKRKTQRRVERRVEDREASAMRGKELSLKFNEKKAFGSFCLRLTEERISFVLAGNQTLIIRGVEQVGDLPDRVRGWFETLQDSGLVTILPPEPPGKRKLPTAEEADKILEELIKEF